ncbi:hypothetical protein WG66_011525 [Moniliophthora roreri]|nr:hypothetical protein WG66_011525 [Moniliophthora roreri]
MSMHDNVIDLLVAFFAPYRDFLFVETSRSTLVLPFAVRKSYHTLGVVCWSSLPTTFAELSLEPIHSFIDPVSSPIMSSSAHIPLVSCRIPWNSSIMLFCLALLSFLPVRPHTLTLHFLFISVHLYSCVG